VTDRYAVIGNPIARSGSPGIHAASGRGVHPATAPALAMLGAAA
jgi:shikimate 5-dehydrogenase